MLIAVSWTGEALARDTIRIVGSSTVYPYSASVAEQFGATTQYPTPVVESTGTGGGFKLFCDGVGVDTPDIADASRRIKQSEFGRCNDAGVRISEIQIGYDGIVLANLKESRQLELSLKQIFMALAKRVPNENGELVENPHRRWSDIDPSLPEDRIEVFGPPPTSGTRDAFVEIAMEKGARGFESLAELEKSDEDAFEQVAHRIREDGAWIDAGENDNAIVSTLVQTPTALGVFGFGFLDQNRDRMQPVIVSGTEPTMDSIASEDYPISRSLFIYVKVNHAEGVVPGLEGFVAEYTSEDAWGTFGYLTEKGLIPLSRERRAEERAEALNLAPLNGL
jgi:phosphate transport system substrate-binding protein